MNSPVFKFSQPAELDMTIIIVSFNTREILLRCLGSIKKHTQDISYEVIVVDNASEDGTVDAVVELFPEVEVIANKDNRGFSAANNQGIIASKGRKIALLNPDTLLTENSFKRSMTFWKNILISPFLERALSMRIISPVPFACGKTVPRTRH